MAAAGIAGEALRISATTGAVTATAESTKPLEQARTAPLTPERLREHLGKLGETGYGLDGLDCTGLGGAVILPIGEINRLRRELVAKLDAAREVTREERPVRVAEVIERVRAQGTHATGAAELTVLCRTAEQLTATLDAGVGNVLVDYEDIRRYKDAVALVREHGAGARIYLATPRIQKAGEEGFFKLITAAQPDGVLIRNLGAIDFFAGAGIPLLGDFSLNVANPLTAEFFKERGLERVTVSYDLNIGQVLDLLRSAPVEWFQLTIHQHMPMFHMEHCVFAAFMSGGRSFLDCGRPCEKHRVHLRDRVGIEHPLRVDVGCRNTLYNAVAQTGAQFFDELMATGLRSYRVELLEEDAAETGRIIKAYRRLLAGDESGYDLWQTLHAQSQLGVTRGTY
jgi:putative protease